MKTNDLLFFPSQPQGRRRVLESPLVFLEERKPQQRSCSPDFGFAQHPVCTSSPTYLLRQSLHLPDPLSYDGVNNKYLMGLYVIICMKSIKQCPNVQELSMNSFPLTHTPEFTVQVKAYQPVQKIQNMLILNLNSTSE